MHAIRKADCPNCGGPIEFKLGSAAACICPYCRFSVVRTELSVEAIGKMAELVPTAPFMAVGDTGSIAGEGFRVGGRLQLDHGRGPWDEWYIEYDGGDWGWLAQGQGDFFTTRPLAAESLPAFDELEPGTRISLAAAGDLGLTVEERGGSAQLSAEGELPFRIEPKASGRYVDLTGSGGVFATIDYGDGSEPPQLFVGRRVSREELQVTGRGLGPAPEQKVGADRLRCPTCGAPVSITTPGETMRAACESCHSLLDYDSGDLRFLKKLDQPDVRPSIPLGTEGVIAGEEVVFIGYLRKFTPDDYFPYTWSEYLVHTRYGYRWLMEDQGHFTYLRPVAAADVHDGGGAATYRADSFRAFQTGLAEVGAVLGEFYWRVEAGDQTNTRDYVAPPRLLSCELTDKEVNWTLGEYVDAKTLWGALSLPGAPPFQQGVAAAQPNPIDWSLTWKAAVALMVALAITAFVTPGRVLPVAFEMPLNVPRATGENPPAEESVTYTRQFEVERDYTTIGVQLETNLSNSWMAVAAALINEDTNEVREFWIQAEEWHGIGWQEGDKNQSEYLSRVPKGRYTMRFDTRWGRQGVAMASIAPQAKVKATRGDRSSLACMLAALLILLPAMIAGIRRLVFEGQRWKASDHAQNLLEMDE